MTALYAILEDESQEAFLSWAAGQPNRQETTAFIDSWLDSASRHYVHSKATSSILSRTLSDAKLPQDRAQGNRDATTGRVDICFVKGQPIQILPRHLSRKYLGPRRQ